MQTAVIQVHLIGNVGNMSESVTTMWKMLAENQLTSNVADAMTGIVAWSCVNCVTARLPSPSMTCGALLQWR